MRENEFEKQLRHLMEEFHLSPSNAVWDKISSRLNRQRRRKTPFVFLVAISLVIIGFFIFLASDNYVQHSNTISNKNNSVKRDSVSINNQEKPITPKIDLKEEKDNASANKTVYMPNKKIYNKIPGSINAVNNAMPYKNRFSVNENSIQPGEKDNNDHVQQVYQKKDSVFADNSLYDHPANMQPIAIADSSKAEINNGNPGNKNFAGNDSDLLAQNEKTTPEQAVKKASAVKYKIPNWQWGVVAFYGKSNAIESMLDFNKSALAYVSNPGTNNIDTVVNTAHPFSASHAYQFGGIVQRKILKNGFITSGINFIHLSTEANIKQQVDSAVFIPGYNGLGNNYVSQYYQPGSLKNYRSTYNFIELPLYIQQDFFPEKKISFSYNAGFSMRQLLSSKALIYDQYNNIYFSKDELLHKTQFQFAAGLSLKINAGKSSAIYIGPQFAYSLSGLLKNTNNNFHFMNYGLQAGLLFHKK